MGLQSIFKKCLSEGVFPKAWKFANVQPIHKKNSREIKSNYCPISLLPVYGKILEKIVFDELYSFTNNNNLISKDQSDFRPGDSTINQLICITSSIFESFENFEETRALFLDISKDFDKVWHEGLIFKLERNRVSGPLSAFSSNWNEMGYLVRSQHFLQIGTKWGIWSALSIFFKLERNGVSGPLLAFFLNIIFMKGIDGLF